jgi:hypothetical protein
MGTRKKSEQPKYEPPYLKELVPDTTLTKVDEAFPAHGLKLMPRYEDIPEEFKRGENKWTRFQRDAFHHGCEGLEFDRKEGIDAAAAFRHLQCINGSFEPKHEHKMAAFAYLASLWFEDVRYTIPERKKSG